MILYVWPLGPDPPTLMLTEDRLYQDALCPPLVRMPVRRILELTDLVEDTPRI